MRKNIFTILACATTAAIMFGCGSGAKKAAAEAAAEKARQDSIAAAEEAAKAKTIMETIATLPEEPVFDIETNLGTIKVKLYSKTPLHRENFEKLALGGYYDSLLFHRVINGFMIQGGDPYTKDTSMVAKYGQGGPGYTVPAEILPEYRHKKGALAAARRGDAANPARESSGSQFYLVQDENACAQLDGAYTVFGETVDGLNVIDKIAQVATDQRDRPVSDVRIISVKLDPSSIPAPADTTAAAPAEKAAEEAGK